MPDFDESLHARAHGKFAAMGSTHVAKGNTYAGKEVLNSAGFKYDPESKLWHGNDSAKDEFNRISSPTYGRANAKATAGITLEKIGGSHATAAPAVKTDSPLATWAKHADPMATNPKAPNVKEWKESEHPKDQHGQLETHGATAPESHAYLKIERPGGNIEHVDVTGMRLQHGIGSDPIAGQRLFEKVKDSTAKAGRGNVLSIHLRQHQDTAADKQRDKESNEYGEHQQRMRQAMTGGGRTY